MWRSRGAPCGELPLGFCHPGGAAAAEPGHAPLPHQKSASSVKTKFRPGSFTPEPWMR